MEIVEGRIVDDSCVFCGLHFGPGGGHYYKGRRNKYGNVETEEGGLVIEHQGGCSGIQLCPECLTKVRSVGIEI